MYNKYLEAFITAADCGSLNKASELMYLSTTAIMKQINQLEKHLGIQLFIRTNKGLQLSEAGKSLYQDARYIIQFSDEALERARNIMKNKDYLIRIGTSLMNPVQNISSYLNKISSENDNFQFHIVPFDDYKDSYAQILHHLGEQIDLIAGIYGFSTWSSSLHNTLTLSNEPVCIALSNRHPLAVKDELQITDLYGESLFITESGKSSVLDKIYSDLSMMHPQIHFIQTTTFDMTLFNQCEHSNHLLLTTPAWAALHPMLKIMPVHWEYTVPYGILYSLHPSKGVAEFIKLFKKYINPKTD